MFRRCLCLALSTILSSLSAAPTHASTPSLVSYQGVLTDPGGTPQVGTFSVVFSVYSTPNGGPVLWSETQSVTTDSQGQFNVLLGSTTPLTDAVFSNPDRYLGTAVSTDAETVPRTRIVTVAYAFRAATIDGATGGSIAGNINLESSTATSGNLLKGGVLFMHDFGSHNTCLGANAGNLTMTGIGDNTAVGYRALTKNNSGAGNTAVGSSALDSNTFGIWNTSVGIYALAGNRTGEFNTACGSEALNHNTTGVGNTAMGGDAMRSNLNGINNTACGSVALYNNIHGNNNTAIGFAADVAADSLNNATAIGYSAVVDASNKIRLGSPDVTVIEGQVAYTFTSDRNEKENFREIDGDAVLRKLTDLSVTSWNYKGQDPGQFRHYGPVAQDFFAAFGHDDVGASGSPTTINSGDEVGILMIAVQALERRNQELESTVAELKSRIERLEVK